MFIIWEVGTKIPTIEIMQNYFAVARGTIQNCIKKLEDSQDIELKSCGSQGTYLVSKNLEKLLLSANIEHIVGALPIPDSCRSNSLANFIKEELLFDGHVKNMLIHTRGSKERLELIDDYRFDYVIISKFMANLHNNEYERLKIIKEFGPSTLFSSIKLIYANAHTQLTNGIKVGISSENHDQYIATKHFLDHYDPHYIDCDFLQLNHKLLNNEVDVIVRAAEFVSDDIKHLKNEVLNGQHCDDMTNAVIAVNKDRLDIAFLLDMAFNKIDANYSYPNASESK